LVVGLYVALERLDEVLDEALEGAFDEALEVELFDAGLDC